MAENTTPITNPAETDYLAAIETLKANSVPREEYEALRTQFKGLLEAHVKGEQPTQTATKPKALTIPEMQNKLFNESLTEMERIETQLDLRDAILEQTGKDIYVPSSPRTVVTDQDRQDAEMAAKIFRHCLEVADGDEDMFKSELSRWVIDVGPVIKPQQRGTRKY